MFERIRLADALHAGFTAGHDGKRDDPALVQRGWETWTDFGAGQLYDQARGRALTTSGAMAWAATPQGGALDWAAAGTNAYAEYPILTSYPTLYTFASLFVVGTLQDESVHLVMQNGITGNYDRRLMIKSSGLLEWYSFSDLAWVSSNSSVTSGQLVHAAFTWDGSNGRFYINGRLDKTQSASSGGDAGYSSPIVRLGYHGESSGSSRTHKLLSFGYVPYPMDAGQIHELWQRPFGQVAPRRRVRPHVATSGTTYNDTIADAVTGAESFATRLTAVGTISGAVTATESNASAHTMPNTISGAVTAAEGSVASQVMPNPITDDVTGGEAFGTTAVFNSALSDGATAADNVEGSVSSTYNETIADSVTAADAMEGEIPNTGDTHEGFVRRTRRQRALDAAERKRRDDAVAEAMALRLSLEAAMGMAVEAVEEAPPEAAKALERATEAARPMPAVLARAPDYSALEAARVTVAALHQAIAEAARAKALADDDADVEILLRAL
jgi:hypothetical protein